MMKTVRFLGTLAIVASMLTACQEDLQNGTQPNKSTSHSSLRAASDCNCVESYDPADKVIFTSGSPEIKVEVWNDATTVYYKLYRTDEGKIGNLFVDDREEAEGGSNIEIYNFVKPVGDLEACDEQTTALRVVGASGSPIEFSVVYKIVTLCPPPPPTCMTYTYDTGFGGLTKGTGKAWWYFYTAGSGEQNIWAGQTKPAGTVMIDGAGNFTIVLADGWELKTGDTESVKIQGYDVAPASRPAAGLFSGPSSYKGTSLTGQIPPKAVYVVHLDLQKCADL